MTRHDTTEHGTTRHNTSVSLLLEVESGGVPCVSEKDGGRSEGPSMHNYRGGPTRSPLNQTELKVSRGMSLMIWHLTWGPPGASNCSQGRTTIVTNQI